MKGNCCKCGALAEVSKETTVQWYEDRGDRADKFIDQQTIEKELWCKSCLQFCKLQPDGRLAHTIKINGSQKEFDEIYEVDEPTGLPKCRWCDRIDFDVLGWVGVNLAEAKEEGELK